MNDRLGIVQVRMGSRRLPGKVLADLAGRPLLERLVDRISQVSRLDRVIVATTVRPEDDDVERFCAAHGIACFRGDADDVLDRFYQAAKAYGARVVSRHLADSPLTDPTITDEALRLFEKGKFDYVSNVIHPTYPDGVEAEVFSFAALEKAWNEARLCSEREHVTPYLLNHPEIFRHFSIEQEENISHLRWTVDEPRDLEFAQQVYAHFEDRMFSTADVLQLLSEEPELRKINAGIERNEGYRLSLENDAVIRPAMGSGQKLYEKAKRLIPGGTQLLSKRPEMFLPDQWPAYYSKARGCEVWDLDGRRYLDFSISGVGSCLLGYADPEVNAAVHAAVEGGSMSTLNCPEEVELAELLCELHPWANSTRFTRSGGEAMAVAVRIARAHTGRDVVAFCGYHGWSDWYLAANLAEDRGLDGHLLPGLEPKGVARGLQTTAIPFRYNHPEDIEAIVRDHGTRLAAIITEPIRSAEPEPGFFESVTTAARKTGAVLLVDEITMGFRLARGGAHLLYGLEPDIAVFAKGMSNGYPMGAIVGREPVMQAAQETFISSTFWTERIGPTAALATIRKLLDRNASDTICETGRRIKAGWQRAAEACGLALKVGGVDALPNFAISCDNPQAARTLFSQEMLDRGYLAVPAVYVTLAHASDEVEAYLQAAGSALSMVAAAIGEGTVEKLLRGPIAHAGFHRLA